MELDEINKLEEKVKHMVDHLQQVKKENQQMKLEMEQFQKESSLKDEERLEIKKKVTTLIELIDSLND